MEGKKPPGLRWMKKPGQIREARKSGVFSRGEHLLAWVTEGSGDESGPPAVGIVLHGGFRRAVDRNFVRRRLRGCIMEISDLLKPGHIYLIECKRGAGLVNYQILVNELRDMIQRSGY